LAPYHFYAAYKMSLCQFLPINSLLFRYTEKVYYVILQIRYILYLEEKEDGFYFKKICKSFGFIVGCYDVINSLR